MFIVPGHFRVKVAVCFRVHVQVHARDRKSGEVLYFFLRVGILLTFDAKR